MEAYLKFCIKVEGFLFQRGGLNREGSKIELLRCLIQSLEAHEDS